MHAEQDRVSGKHSDDSNACDYVIDMKTVKRQRQENWETDMKQRFVRKIKLFLEKTQNMHRGSNNNKGTHTTRSGSSSIPIGGEILSQV